MNRKGTHTAKSWESPTPAQVLAIMQNSDYFVPPTQCNAQGVPQGGYLDMTSFIADQARGLSGHKETRHPRLVRAVAASRGSAICGDGAPLCLCSAASFGPHPLPALESQGFKTGKGGYQKDYPPLYVLRPDGSTLYTYRDVVYSIKKARTEEGRMSAGGLKET